MSEPEDRHPEVVRITALLETVLRTRRVRIIDVERRLNLSNGTLRRIFDGRIALKYQHIVELLEVLGVSLANFFRIAYEHQATEIPPDGLGAEMLHQASRLTAILEARPSLADSDLSQVVEDALRKVLPEHLLIKTSSPPPVSDYAPARSRRQRSRR